MRAIDADALKDYIDAQEGRPFIGCTIGEALKIMTDEQPTIQPEPHEIGYDDCANALLKMWMDNVLTDGDYYRIADKLNKKWGKTELPEPYTEPYKGVTE